MMGMPAKPRNKLRPLVPSVDKAFRILEFMAGQKDAYSITELSRRFKIPVSTMNNLLLTLVYCGYLNRNDKGTFRVSMKLLQEAGKLMENNDLRDVARDDLEKLSAFTELTSVLAVRDGDQIMCIDKCEGASQIRVASSIGKRFHLHCTATGKAILSQLPEEEVEAIAARTGLPAVTPNTITSIKTLQKELARARKQGYAEESEENTIGIRGIAAAILDHTGQVVGAISTGGVGFQLGDRIKAFIAAVQDRAQSISGKMGFHEAAAIEESPVAAMR
jgi:IclR family acetate operon transcriptional repressor